MINSTLEELVQYVKTKSPYYAEKLAKVNLDGLTDRDLLKKLPLTSKDDLAGANDKFLCVEPNQIADYVTTSGTLGKPVSFCLTKNDLDRLAENEAAAMSLAGVTSKDVVQLLVTMDRQFMAGLAYYLGVQKLGAGSVRIGPGVLPAQLDAILKFKTTVLVAVPSFVIKLIEHANNVGINLNETSVKTIICIGEPIRDAGLKLNALGQRISDQWNVDLRSTYASTEKGAAFTECEAKQGGHLNDELLVLEVLDEDGNQVKNGERGEVVVTTLGVEGMPLLRYQTGDICQYIDEKCSCGLETPRLGPVLGRKKHMIKYKGTTLFPMTIFEVLNKQSIELYQLNIHKDSLGQDRIELHLDNALSDEHVNTLTQTFKSEIRVIPEIKLVQKDTLFTQVFPASSRKPVKVVFH